MQQEIELYIKTYSTGKFNSFIRSFQNYKHLIPMNICL